MRENRLKKFTGVRLPLELAEEMEFIRDVEGSTVTALVIEGLQMVADKRRNDPEFMQKALQWRNRADQFIERTSSSQ